MVVAQAMAYPYLKLVGGVLLLWVAVKLVVPDDPDEEGVKTADNLWRAVWIVTIADIVMSLDNVIAIAASAETAASAVDPAHAVAIKATLIIFGLATSVPLIIAGSALLMALLERFPILVWGGGALLGWVAGDIITKDGALLNFLSPEKLEQLHYWAAAAGALFVLGMGFLLTRGRRAAETKV
jgi:YjbE family integral membrane protein